ncbi:ArnT family glycosyltransferase [Armatimonas rosea]|uniref:4-amino-4-deoxy-L-arabinose transferase-like glycosyltransferase n=1 Tax=Armatimonas rosea TaxID=685828 RepID=A0A7W9SSJ8_ARMRO|nr:glycosyltransferase family 39 protein [Armatimonas rosea]MBB6051595.1 4-amino-4-deoxy-L-arabinose transferase-like glycosyltransferase [Armatimonas rosea]
MRQLLATILKHRTIFIIAFMIVAFLLRISAAVALRNIHLPPDKTFGADGIEFNLLGLQLIRGHGYAWESGQLTSFRAPGLPFLLAGLYSLVGENYVFSYLTFSLLGMFSCLFIFLTAEILLSKKLAILSALLSAFYFPHIYFSTVFASENLFIFLLSLGILLFTKNLKTESRYGLILSGLILGFSTLTRPFAILLLPAFLLVIVITHKKNVARAIFPAILYALSFTSIVAPWTIRNYLVHGKFVLVATNGGSTFYGGNNTTVATQPKLLGAWVSTTELPYRSMVDATPNEYAHDKMEWKLGIDWIRDHPLSIPVLFISKIIRFFLPDFNSGNKLMLLSNVIFSTPVLILCIIGIVKSLKTYRLFSTEWLVIHLAMTSTLITAIVFWGDPRFRDGTMIALILYATYGLSAILPKQLSSLFD